MLGERDFVLLDREASGTQEDSAGFGRDGLGRPEQGKQCIEKVGWMGRRSEVTPEGIGIRRKIGVGGVLMR